MDDAAIYQASARNSKGIVSCSGVLEVGNMSEYKIHQKFFAKLKQKAELKRKELEHNYLQEKENILQEQLSSNLNNVMMNDGLVHNLSSVQAEEDNEVIVSEIIEEQPETHIEEFNRLSLKVHRNSVRSDRSQENDNQHMSSDIDQKAGNEEIFDGSKKAEIGDNTKSTTVSKNNITIYSEPLEPITTPSCQGPEEGEKTHEGMSQENILQLKFGDEHKKTTPQLQEITNSKAKTIQERKREKVDTEGKHMKVEKRHQGWESCWEEEEQKKSLEEKQENGRQPEPERMDVAAPEAKTLVYKEQVNQHKSALSSVFHSLKDIFFGKSKKSPEITDSSLIISDITVEKEILEDNTRAHCHLPQTQPQRCDTTSGVCGTMPDQLVPVAIDQQNQIETLHVNTPFSQETPSVNIKTEMETSNLGNHIPGLTTNYIKDIFKASMIHHESVEEEKEDGPEALQRSTLLTVYEVSLFYIFSMLILLSIIHMHVRIHFIFQKATISFISNEG